MKGVCLLHADWLPTCISYKHTLDVYDGREAGIH